VVAGIVLAVVLLSSGGSYTLSALFEDAGQLVAGGEVQVAGRPVGTISAISVTSNGLAKVKMSIGQSGVTPLHRGTRALIRATGLAGVASRYIELSPGPSNQPSLPDGYVLPSAQTSGIVELDELVDTLGAPTTRADIRAVLDHGAQLFAGSNSSYFNAMLAKFDPALHELQATTAELAYDGGALRGLVHTASQTVSALASEPNALAGATDNAAQAFGEIASQRTALADEIGRAPAVLSQAAGVLSQTSVAVNALRPTLRELVPVAPPLAELLRRVPSTLTPAQPVLDSVSRLLPGIRTTLTGLVPLATAGVKALRTLPAAIQAAMPIVIGLRIYGADFLLGVTNGLAGILASNYNELGHYGRLNFVENPQTLLAGPLASLLSQVPLVPGILNTRSGILARCPGGNEPPAPDNSNRVIQDPSLCNTSDSIPLSVDQP
jgi:phospholipid/cholesterol/gamma-HCH transport system substrate-binding protein